MKFKVGDKIKIADDLTVFDDFSNPPADDMFQYAGEITTIKSINGNAIHLDIDNGFWFWYEPELTLIPDKCHWDSDEFKPCSGFSGELSIKNDMPVCSSCQEDIRKNKKAIKISIEGAKELIDINPDNINLIGTEFCEENRYFLTKVGFNTTSGKLFQFVGLNGESYSGTIATLDELLEHRAGKLYKLSSKKAMLDWLGEAL